MIIWSTFLLDELAGLRERCAADVPGMQGRPDVPVEEQWRGERRFRSGR